MMPFRPTRMIGLASVGILVAVLTNGHLVAGLLTSAIVGSIAGIYFGVSDIIDEQKKKDNESGDETNS